MKTTTIGNNAMKISHFISICALLLLSTGSLSAQFENYTWFSGGSRVQFDIRTQEPKISANPNRFSSEGGATLNDPLTGDPLFYTDGNTVYNRLHQVMANGRDLGGSETNAQGCAIAVVPGECKQYYLFVNGLDAPNGLRVSKIDLNANGGLGTVLSNYKNRFLRKDVFEGMQVVPKPSSNDSWLIVPVDPKTGVTQIVFAITNSGIRQVDSINGPYVTRHYGLVYHPGQRKLAGCAPHENLIYTLDFNPFTGILSNLDTITNKLALAYDAEWSPDGSKLYFSSWRNLKLWQYDYNSKQTTVIFESPGDGGGMKLGPDGRIYYIESLESKRIGRIHQPNLAGRACDFRPNELLAPQGLNFNFSEILAVSPQPNRSTISGIINHYAAVEDICGNQFRVQSTKGFAVGDTVMIIQMQGAKIDTTNTPNFGKILDYGNAGKYEFNIISKIDGDEVFFQRKLLNQYDVAGRVQLVSFPNLGDASICNLTCKPWDGRTGGILAFNGGHLSLYGAIDVTGKGFRGGKNVAEIGAEYCITGYVYPGTTSVIAAFKGESIAEIYPNLARGRGSYGSGGGGGNNHNTGGGGGANAGAGGLGGTYVICTNPETRGIGGNSLDFNQQRTRLFMGGGGGAGHNNNGFGTRGGNGGGITFIIAKSIENVNTACLLANGESMMVTDTSYSEAPDGGGGGGAGGNVVLLLTQNQNKSIPIQIRGGDGASVNYIHGHGGGGGGGAVFLSPNLIPSNFQIDARGGKSGIGVDGKTNLATNGQPGISRSINELPLNRTEYVMLGWDSISIDPTCAGTTDAYLWVRSSVDTLEYSLDGTSWQSESFFEGLTVTSQRFYVRDGCRQLDTLLKVAFYPKMSVRNNFKDLICNSSGLVELVASQGKAPYSYRQGGKVWQDVGLFNNLAAGIYTFQTVDALGCLQNDTFEIADRSYKLEVVMSNDTTIYKGSNARISAQWKGEAQQPMGFTWTPAVTLSCPGCAQTYAKPEASTLYTATLKDANGCSGVGQVQVKVIPNTVFWPNVFALKSGINGMFYPQGDPSKISSIDLNIYNRWGNLVYTNKNIGINDSGQGWDGRINGQAATTGVYVYIGKVTFYDGTVEQYQGSVTLLR